MELLTQLHAELGSVLKRVQRAESLNLHYERVLRQAVLTHGGKLVVDTKHADMARDGGGELWIANGGVTLHWPGAGFSDSGAMPQKPLSELDE